MADGRARESQRVPNAEATHKALVSALLSVDESAVRVAVICLACACGEFKQVGHYFCNGCFCRMPSEVTSKLCAGGAAELGRRRKVEAYEMAIAWLLDNPLPPTEQESTPGYVYALQMMGLVKIGRSKRPTQRAKQIVGQLPLDAHMIAVLPTRNMAKLERALHEEFDHCRVRGEWFNLDSGAVDWLVQIAARATNGGRPVDIFDYCSGYKANGPA